MKGARGVDESRVHESRVLIQVAAEPGAQIRDKARESFLFDMSCFFFGL